MCCQNMAEYCQYIFKIPSKYFTVHSCVIEWVGEWRICYNTDMIVADWPGTGTCCDVTSAGGRSTSAPVRWPCQYLMSAQGTASRRHYIISLVGRSPAVSAIFLLPIAAVIAGLEATEMTHRVQKLCVACAAHQLLLYSDVDCFLRRFPRDNYTVSKKRGVEFFALTSSTVNRFWKFFHCWKQH